MPLSKVAAVEMEFVRDLVRKRAAIVLEAGKEYLVETRLENVAKAAGFVSTNAFINEAQKGSAVLQKKIVEALTTHESTFFRDVHPFEALRKDVLPALIAACERSRTLTIWSAACSTGQEPYSLAMLILENFPSLAQWPVRIVATDISDQILERARIARFHQMEVNRGLPSAMLVKYFDRRGIEWEVKPNVRHLVDFRSVNLLDPWPPSLNPDIVCLRNVLIYFDLATKREILGRLRRVLAPDGALFLGAAETTIGIDDAWTRVTNAQTSWYQVRR